LADAQSRPRSEVLRYAITTSVPDVPAQFDQVDAKFVYLPLRHLRALRPETMVVEGIRGAGKSFWWFVLKSDSLRRAVLPDDVEISIGFAQDEKGDWPEKDELEQLLSLGSDPRLIWKAVFLRQNGLSPKSDVSRNKWQNTIEWVKNNPSIIASRLRDFDEQTRVAGKTRIILFDGLDRTAATRENQEKLLRGLLEFVIEFRGYRTLRAKVFARPDMLKSPKVRAFPDASKVLAASVSLEWRPVDLYGLLFQYLGNARDLGAAAAFRRLVERGPSSSAVVDGAVWRVPEALREDKERQENIFGQIAGPYMGTNHRKGKTYPWIPNHLSDALDQVSPRSFLAAIHRASVEPSPHKYALHWSGIYEGVRSASKIRVDEIAEDLPWVHAAMKLLHGLVVPCESSQILSAWRKGNLLKQDQPSLPASLDAAMEELISMGIFKVRTDARLNIPDVYRVGFGLRRKGGFAPKN
jgi:hypothetical protein